jgi:translation elongation factor EF-Tu-like GTPase
MSDSPLLDQDPDIEAQITYLTTQEGGKKNPAFTGYTPQFHYEGRDWDAVHRYPDVELVMPGQTARVYLTFVSPQCHIGRLHPGKEFLIREGPHTVAKGHVTKILNLEASAKRVGRDASNCW